MFNNASAKSVDIASSGATSQFASFDARFFALAMDGIILLMLDIAITTQIFPALKGIANYFLIFTLWALYTSLLESRSSSATLGMMWKGIKVVDVKGEVISIRKSFIRFLLRFLSFATLGIGFFIQPFTARKQTLHDLLCGTIVIVTNESKHNAKSIGTLKKAFLLLALSFVVVSFIAMWAIGDYKKKEHFSRLREVVDPIRLEEENLVRANKNLLNLNFPNNWNGLGLAAKPVLPQEIDGIYLTETGVIMLEVAPWVIDRSCQVINTPSVKNLNIEWKVASNCPPEYIRSSFIIDERLTDSDAEKISRLIHAEAKVKEKNMGSPKSTGQVDSVTLQQKK
jgi:uncharacterized RDD family membrane protein YckC